MIINALYYFNLDNIMVKDFRRDIFIDEAHTSGMGGIFSEWR